MIQTTSIGVNDYNSASSSINTINTSNATVNSTNSLIGNNASYIPGTLNIGIGNWNNNYNNCILSPTKSLLFYLKESEIIDLLEKLKNRMDKNNFENMVTEIVSIRHFSEEFLMKYIDILSINTILIQHSGDVQSGDYTQIKLLEDLN